MSDEKSLRQSHNYQPLNKFFMGLVLVRFQKFPVRTFFSVDLFTVSKYSLYVFWIFRYDVVVDYFLRRYLNRLSESNEDMKQALFEQGWNVDPNVQIDQDLIISLYGKYSSFNGTYFFSISSTPCLIYILYKYTVPHLST